MELSDNILYICILSDNIHWDSMELYNNKLKMYKYTVNV